VAVAYLVRPDGCRLYYEVHGPQDRSPLLLLEGIGGTIPGWRGSLGRFAERFLVVAYDFRGNGRSDKPDREMPITLLAEDTTAVLDQVGIESTHVYAQSLGGMVAIQMALSDPARIRSLVLGATHAGHAGAFHRLSWKASKGQPFVMLYAPSFLQRHPERVTEDLRIVQEQPQPPGVQRRQWEAIQGWDAWDRLEEIPHPTLVLHGTQDRLVPPENGRRVAEMIPGAELHLIEGAGHVYHWEKPEEAEAVVLDFLARAEAAR
jgi:3-oxoadipate enol-lactonase